MNRTFNIQTLSFIFQSSAANSENPAQKQTKLKLFNLRSENIRSRHLFDNLNGRLHYQAIVKGREPEF